MPARRVLSVLAAPFLALCLVSSASPGTLSRMTTAHVTKPALRCTTSVGMSLGIATEIPIASRLLGHRSP